MKKILVVDDEPEILDLVQMRLEANDYKVITAKDGNEAIIKAKREQPDLVIMDIMMPHLSGGDAVRMLQSQKETQSIPVIFLTGVIDQPNQNEEEKQKVNVDGHYYVAIAKPFDPADLIDEVKNALGDND